MKYILIIMLYRGGVDHISFLNLEDCMRAKTLVVTSNYEPVDELTLVCVPAKE